MWYEPKKYVSTGEEHYTGWQEVSIWLLVAATILVGYMVASKTFLKPIAKNWLLVREGSPGHMLFYVVLLVMLLFSTLSFFANDPNFIRLPK